MRRIVVVVAGGRVINNQLASRLDWGEGNSISANAENWGKWVLVCLLFPGWIILRSQFIVRN